MFYSLVKDKIQFPDGSYPKVTYHKAKCIKLHENMRHASNVPLFGLYQVHQSFLVVCHIASIATSISLRLSAAKLPLESIRIGVAQRTKKCSNPAICDVQCLIRFLHLQIYLATSSSCGCKTASSQSDDLKSTSFF